MSEDNEALLFADDAAIAAVGNGLLDRDLPRPAWTHEAHLAACAWLIRMRPDIDLEHELPAIIRGYNAAVGGVNDDHQGYHETITQFMLATVRAFLARAEMAIPLVDAVNALLVAPEGHREWPLRFYSRERLFSVEARRGWVDPDLIGTVPRQPST
ncbi:MULTISPECIES: hypothetical protein [unclassified Sphingomonas]|jgi:hypothetical protein|uniref:hypothetical protein n=1 Tax=unclassified Sphingomonas TaxID=196159 RepID=UPI0008333D10|nr:MULTISPECIES: hypothetical protein [unclassified Sphingomonas]